MATELASLMEAVRRLRFPIAVAGVGRKAREQRFQGKKARPSKFNCFGNRNSGVENPPADGKDTQLAISFSSSLTDLF